MLETLAGHARERGVTLLRLETGIHQREAISLYESWGFRRRAPFGSYVDDPVSVYMECQIE
jgi:ribosomal protein S18 acetylase RimI-like enzyme